MIKAVNNYPNYTVSDDGVVFDLAANAPCVVSVVNGYPTVSLKNENGRQSLRVHRLVAQAFIANPRHKKEVNHKDRVKTNNDVSNLEWCTRQENVAHAVQSGAYARFITGYSQRRNKRLKTPIHYTTAQQP